MIPTVEQYAKMRGKLKDPIGDMADIAVMTGLRISEIRGLAVRNVDLREGCIRIEQRLDAINELDNPKSQKSSRLLPMGSLKEMLKRAITGKVPDSYVFASPTYGQCQRVLKEAAEATGSTRHTSVGTPCGDAITPGSGSLGRARRTP